MMSNLVIAERELLCTPKGGNHRKKLTIRVFAPCQVEEGAVNFEFSPGTSRCVVDFDGINEQVEFFGMDSLQALEMVSKLDRYLAGFSQRYDFYWTTGEPYFEE